MMLRPVETAPPAELFVSLDDLKRQVGYTDDDDDALLLSCIKAARDYLEGQNGILSYKMVAQDWSVSTDAIPSGFDRSLELPFHNVTNAVVTYRDEADAEQTVGSSNFVLLNRVKGSMIIFKGDFTAPELFDRPDAVTITMTCGYGPASAVPSELVHAGKMLAAHWYANREPFGEIQHAVAYGVSALTASYRRQRV